MPRRDASLMAYRRRVARRVLQKLAPRGVWAACVGMLCAAWRQTHGFSVLDIETQTRLCALVSWSIANCRRLSWALVGSHHSDGCVQGSFPSVCLPYCRMLSIRLVSVNPTHQFDVSALGKIGVDAGTVLGQTASSASARGGAPEVAAAASRNRANGCSGQCSCKCRWSSFMS